MYYNNNNNNNYNNNNKVWIIYLNYFLSNQVVGFDVPDRFVIGYGLDYNEVFRDMDVSAWFLFEFTYIVIDFWIYLFIDS